MADAQQQGVWHTTVTEAINIFRDAQCALIPVVERAHIPWRGDTYDDWERIANALFESIVADAVIHSLPAEDAETVRIPALGMLYQDLSGMSFIEVMRPGLTSPPYPAFLQYSTRTTPFDTVEYLTIDPAGQPLSEKIESVRADGVTFRFQHRRPSGQLRSMDSLHVTL